MSFENMNLNLDIEKLETWLPKSTQVNIISGPCSAESFEQLFQTCSELKNKGITVFRAGVWKPRTRPNSFEGYGEKALPWIAEVKKELQIPFMIEVANPSHIEKALKYDIDFFWIGARTTVNPFNVQEIANALRGIDIPILIKNPVNPDLALWIGAIERIYQVGIRKMAVIHRGFSSFKKTKYRNEPLWQIPIELKTLIPNMPLICDPSHMGGRRDLLQEISQRALNLNYEGLMIESHITPDKALSDAKQQVTPQRLAEILLELNYRQSDNDTTWEHTLEDLRAKIDIIDQELIDVIAERMRLIDKIGLYKKDHNMTIFQLERWEEVFATRPAWAEKIDLHSNFIGELYKLIHWESIRRQSNIMKDNNSKEII